MGQLLSHWGMTWAELARVVADLAPKITGAWIQKVRQTREDAVILECRAPGETLLLLFSANAKFFRFVPLEQKPEEPSAASAFCMLLRKRLAGGRVEELAIDAADRIVTLAVHKKDEDGIEGVWTLVGEFFGLMSNVLLLDPNGILIEALFSKRLPGRSLAPGQIYLAPPKPAQTSTSDCGLPVEQMAETLAQAEAQYEILTYSTRLQTAITRESKREHKYLAKLKAELEHLPNHQLLTKKAETLLSFLSQVQKGQTEVQLMDFENPEGPPLNIELNPARSPQDNANAMFKTARRIRRKADELNSRRKEVEKKAETLGQVEQELDQAADIEALEKIESRLNELGISLVKPQAQVKPKGKPTAAGPRPFLAEDGATIYVGRNAEENEEITFQIARGNDYWLHIEGAPGSHVVIKLPQSGELANDTLLDAANLALLHSSLKSANAGGVIYTRRKNVHRAKHAATGEVMAGSVKTIFVKLDDERVARLYKTRENIV